MKTPLSSLHIPGAQGIKYPAFADALPTVASNMVLAIYHKFPMSHGTYNVTL
jgi:hypothetical protein